jgi:large subunit ribosomal protein L25
MSQHEIYPHFLASFTSSGTIAQKGNFLSAIYAISSLDSATPASSIAIAIACRLTQSIPFPHHRTMAIQAMSQTVTNPEAYQTLAKTLPNLLIRFFQKFPPGRPYARESQKPSLPQPVTEPSEDGSTKLVAAPSKRDLLRASTPFTDPSYNPFLPWRNPVTLKWRGPYYGLRRQAVLCKTAAAHGVAELLPWSMKLPSVKLARREEKGLRVKGTGEGDRVKGHHWERTMKGKTRTRKEAMVGMPEMVRNWKQVCIHVRFNIRTTTLMRLAERTRQRMEEVAEIDRYCDGLRWAGMDGCLAEWNSQRLCLGVGKHLHGIMAHLRWSPAQSLNMRLSTHVQTICRIIRSSHHASETALPYFACFRTSAQ